MPPKYPTACTAVKKDWYSVESHAAVEKEGEKKHVVRNTMRYPNRQHSEAARRDLDLRGSGTGSPIKTDDSNAFYADNEC